MASEMINSVISAEKSAAEKMNRIQEQAGGLIQKARDEAAAAVEKYKADALKKAEEIKNSAFAQGEKIKDEAAAANAEKAAEIKKNALLKSDEAVAALVREIIS